MPTPGRPPKDPDQRRNRVKLTHDWTEIADLAYRGKVPVKLPARRSPTDPRPLAPATKAWWASVRAMPHCVLWTPTDWQFALFTALIFDDALHGTAGAAAELRQREKILGTTADARRALRIRYVDPKSLGDAKATTTSSSGAAKGAGSVTSLEERRQRLVADAP